MSTRMTIYIIVAVVLIALVAGVAYMSKGKTSEKTFTGDYLDPNRAARVEFTIGHKTSDGIADVTVSFLSDGLQMVASGGSVSVNGKALPPFPLKKQGFWYMSQIPMSSLYRLEYSLGAGRPVVAREVAGREFSVSMPPTISRRAGTVIPFTGPPLRPTESIFAKISVSGTGQREFRLKASASGGTVIIPASELSSVPLGNARLYVGIVLRDETSTDYGLIYIHGSENVVTVVE